MEENHIKNLFTGFYKKIFSAEQKKKDCISIIEKHTGVVLPSQAIFFKENTIVIKTKPIYKNEIFLKKVFILNELKENRLLSIYTEIN